VDYRDHPASEDHPEAFRSERLEVAAFLPLAAYPEAFLAYPEDHLMPAALAYPDLLDRPEAFHLGLPSSVASWQGSSWKGPSDLFLLGDGNVPTL
jgi:hypothetical protein